MPDLRSDVQARLASHLRENLTPLFAQTLNWGGPRGGPRYVSVGAPIGSTLTAQPVARLGGLEVLRVDWPDVRLPTLTQRRAIQHALTPIAADHLMCYVTQDNQQVAFVWARERGEHKVELRTLQYEAGSAARTTVEQIAELAFSLDELQAGEPLVTQVMDRLNAAFDVEAVTDRFFREFRDVFENLKDALPKKMAAPADRHAFTQRLLNRLLFLCFLQKKKWMKSPDLDHPRGTYLFDLFDFCLAEGEEYYRDYLHPLFFNALNRPPAPDLDAERDRLSRKLGIAPFLNGGLFDPTDKWDQAGLLSLPNKLFDPILGERGLLRRFNFTVTESTPLNQEVAVDPEMLGKVFETVVLTSEQAEDYQAPNLRKATGSYYTPRIVVTFIAREALQSYLLARVPGLAPARLARLMEMDASGGLPDEARALLSRTLAQTEAEAIRAHLDTLRACDPAVGSGAFTLGLLHELVNLHLLCETVERGKDPRFSNPNLVFDLKKRIIERNLYGVDLQAKAVEICKLRLWLSLIVDFQSDVDLDTCTAHQFEQAISRIPALPNLTYKIRRGDALLDLVHGQPFHMGEIGRHAAMLDTLDKLQAAQGQFFRAQDPQAKRALRLDALVARTRLTRLQLEYQSKLLTETKLTQLSLLDKETRAEARQREAELAQLDAALAQVKQTEGDLGPLKAKKQWTPAEDERLARLEAFGEGEDMTFTWELDFPEVFSQTLAVSGQPKVGATAPVSQVSGGFDVIVGNPPFVTARNAEKRELYRARWKETAYLKFQLVAPFFQRSFGLLRPGGHLGFIVSNAFAKREFGRPLVEDFFPKVELNKIVDCSGLMFPGHGTPTCIVFGRNLSPKSASPFPVREGGGLPEASTGVRSDAIRIVATLPGGGDLRTPPERSPLWETLQAHHDQPGYSDARIMVADHPRDEMAKWPWNFDVSAEPTKQRMEVGTKRLEEIADSIGPATITRSDEIFIEPADLMRRLAIEKQHILPFIAGDCLRDWTVIDFEYVIFPYGSDYSLADLNHLPNLRDFLRPYKKCLEEVIIFGKAKKETDRAWFEYSDPYPRKNSVPIFIPFTEIATHGHFVFNQSRAIFPQTAPVIKLLPEASTDHHHTLAGLLNSSAALFWLKQMCFNKGAGDEEERDRFVYGGGKVQQLPIPSVLLDAGPVRERLTSLARACWERGQQMPSLAYKKLFEREGEAYTAWNSSLAGWVRPWREERGEWSEANDLREAYQAYRAERERLRSEMMALQEEMDWLVYAAYGLISDFGFLIADWDSPVSPFAPQSEIQNLQLGERPFELVRDGKPMPEHFSAERRALWQARMKVIEENEHVRRIEQPVYKRRWYRKEGDEREFERACEWWLLEKAEWWLENKAHGGPVELSEWASALWQDERVKAVANLRGITDLPGFTRWFKSLVVESAVPDWIPPALDWAQVEKKHKQKIPARAKKIRGKLNVPRERFRLTDEGEYVWAGKV